MLVQIVVFNDFNQFLVIGHIFADWFKAACFAVPVREVLIPTNDNGVITNYFVEGLFEEAEPDWCYL